MRHLSLIALTATVFCIGCSHAEKKSEVPAETKAAASAPQEKAKTEAAKTSESSTKVECAVKGDSRTLEARAKDKGCELAYTKAGKEGIVASAAHGTAYCETALEKLRDKLKGSGYECK